MGRGRRVKFLGAEYISLKTEEVFSMSAIITIVSSSPLLKGFFTFLAIILIGSIVSKAIEVMGKWELAKRIDNAIRIFWICSVIVSVLVFIGIGVLALLTM